jgi:mannose-6-phosphate isomerase-like protein (cupin superfamily)
MPDDPSPADVTVPITGRRLEFPQGPIFSLRRAAESDYQLGEFRAWAGYKNLGSDAATAGIVHFQHVLSFAGTEAAGRTGIHAHLALAHIVIPTSGRGIFSYDGVVTEATPGTVIVQHGGTVHDQFLFTYAATSDADNRRTPQWVERPPPGAPACSFGFLELFVPSAFANVDIVAPGAVTAEDQASAWAHPYHLPGARFALQSEDEPDAAYRPVAGREDLEVRDAGAWAPSAGLVATWIIRPASGDPAAGPPMSVGIAGEAGGIDVFYMVSGEATFRRDDGEELRLAAGDTSTHSQGRLGLPYSCSHDMRLLRFFISDKVRNLRERTADEIRRLEALGPRIVRRREVRRPGDPRPVNGLQDPAG